MAATGSSYFEWRRPVAGGEEHRPSFIKGFDGEINPDKDTLALICREMARILARSWQTQPRAANIALIYDYVNSWARALAASAATVIRATGEIQSFYTGLKSLHCDIDIIPRRQRSFRIQSRGCFQSAID